MIGLRYKHCPLGIYNSLISSTQIAELSKNHCSSLGSNQAQRYHQGEGNRQFLDRNSPQISTDPSRPFDPSRLREPRTNSEGE